MKPVLPFLETMATQACNLSCLGCTNYSNLPFKGYVSWSQAKSWLEPWLERIDIAEFGIIGGEPLLNPEIKSWLYGCRELLPTQQLRFTTNGLLIKSTDELLKICDDIGNIVFKITVHVDDHKLEEKIKEIFESRPWKLVTEHGIQRWALPNGVRFQVNRPQQFVMTYRGPLSGMMPHHSNPSKAFDLCIQKTCPLLWNGKIYKCSTAGLIKDALDKANATTKQHWKNFIDPGITPESRIEDIEKFIDNFGKPNSICAQCPQDSKFLIPHATSVFLKNRRLEKTVDKNTEYVTIVDNIHN